MPISVIIFAALMSVAISSPANAQEASQSIEQSGRLLGQPLSVKQSSAARPVNPGLQSKIDVNFAGAEKTLAEASVEAVPAATPANPGESPPNSVILGKTDWYIGGTRVWNGSLRVQNGALVYGGGVAPTKIPFPLVIYPLGPLVLEVDAGVEFEGDVNASLTPGLSYPLPDSDLQAKLSADLTASGYLEGYAELFVVRGGVGGRLDLITGKTGVGATFHLGQLDKPQLGNFGKVVLLAGSVYGFVDTNLLFGSWTRVIRRNFYHWNGKCFAFGEETCPVTIH